VHEARAAVPLARPQEVLILLCASQTGKAGRQSAPFPARLAAKQPKMGTTSRRSKHKAPALSACQLALCTLAQSGATDAARVALSALSGHIGPAAAGLLFLAPIQPRLKSSKRAKSLLSRWRPARAPTCA
jgi:hypothetical protein